MAAEVIDPAILQWAVGLGLAGAVSLFGTLAKKAFADLAGQVSSVGLKIDSIVSSQAHHDTRVSVLEAKLEAALDDIIGLREAKHRHGDAITSLQARLINRTTSGSFPKVGEDE